MEQLYMIEIFVNKLTVFMREDDLPSSASKNIILKILYGPATQFIVKEGQLAVVGKTEDLIEITDQGRKQWSRSLRVGKSFLFPSYPDTVLANLSKFPLELEVWNDDPDEPDHKLYVGVGRMHWHTGFFHYLKETSDACKVHEPKCIKQIVTLYQECCCVQAGEVSLILRLSALGNSIITEFQQLQEDPDRFCFRTNKAPSMFECKRIEGDDIKFCMIGSLYETTTLEDPDLVSNAQKKIEICTEMQSCGIVGLGPKTRCEQNIPEELKPKPKYAIDRIKMGDITGPCGNTNCPLAHKVKMYIRNLETYKAKAKNVNPTKANVTKKICGTCGCKDDRAHKEDCPHGKPNEKVVCSGCGGMAKSGDTCKSRADKHFTTGNTPKVTPTPSMVQYAKMYYDRDNVYKRNYIVGNFTTKLQCDDSQYDSDNRQSTVKSVATEASYKCFSGYWSECTAGCSDKKGDGASSSKPVANRFIDQCVGPTRINVYSVETKSTAPGIYNVPADDDKDCKCSPPKPTPPCKTFDCNCIPNLVNKSLRKAHRPYCPLYTHKVNCPVNLKDEEENPEDEDEAEPLPYGLPPIKLGPCPVMGRPCTVPDGFARMYKNAQQPTVPPSYCDAGKICCSKEYERIKKAIKEYMTYQKENDMRCINRYNIDTETRCCDKEQTLMALLGRDCCGEHKLALYEKYRGKKT